MSETSGAQKSSTSWHALSQQDVLQKTDSNRQGLSQLEARQRLEKYGPNKLRQQQVRPRWRRLLDQFKSVLIIVLLVAGAVSAAIGQWVDAGAIFAVVLINAVIAYVQEGKAEEALAGIKKMLSLEATVQRDGDRRTINAEEVVVGDIVFISSGDRIPADIRLLKTRQFRAQEAALTGESAPVDKHHEEVDKDADLAERQSMAYAGTLCVHGSAEGVVVATAMDTEIGHISKMLSEVEKIQTPLLRQLDRFGKVLALGIVAIAAAMSAFGMFIHGQSLREMFMPAVGLVVAAIPEGLPAIVTITLALGVRAMANRNAIITRLPAVETLGSVSTIFTDKTGTLTRNEMTATVLAISGMDVEVTGVGFAPEGEFTRSQSDDHHDKPGETLDPRQHNILRALLVTGVLCNESRLKNEQNTWRIQGDPTEGALIVAAAKAGMDLQELRQSHRRLDVIPFESERKYMATLNEDSDAHRRRIHLKGAPDLVLEMCSQVEGQNGPEALDPEPWQARLLDLSARGLRVLALAYKDADQMEEISENSVGENLVLLGLIGIMDPPRESAARAIKTCRSAGIDVKMVTGDHGRTAAAIGKQLGLRYTDRPMSGREIADCSIDELRKRVRETSVFARAAPEHKLRLVEAVQAQGAICAMTGDGVNDAPALKRADVGVAMGIEGTEAAREASEMVLADDNFATIVNAIEEGRKVYANIRKTITFMLPTNGAESMAILIAIVANTSLPITPVQIIWVNMVTAVTLGLALAFEPAEEGIMRRRPRNPKGRILNPFLIWRIIFVSALLVLTVYGVFIWLQTDLGLPVEVARTAAVNMLVAGEVVYLLNARFAVNSSISIRGFFGSRAALIAIAAVLILQFLWTYAPPMQFLFQSANIDGFVWGVIGLIAVAIFLIVEFEKFIWRINKRQVSGGIGARLEGENDD